MNRAEERALVTRAIEVLSAALSSASDQRWGVEHVSATTAQITVRRMGRPAVIADSVETDQADVIALAVPAARGLIAVLQDVKLIMNAYPTPEAVRGEIARGVRLAKLILGEQ